MSSAAGISAAKRRRTNGQSQPNFTNVQNVPPPPRVPTPLELLTNHEVRLREIESRGSHVLNENMDMGDLKDELENMRKKHAQTEKIVDDLKTIVLTLQSSLLKQANPS
jgi:hypothetical protein